MKNIIVVLAIVIPVLTNAQDSSLKKVYKPQIDLSLIGGIQNNQNFEASAPVYGVEISWQCPFITTKKNYIRQQFSFIRQEGKTFKSLTIEINPQYKIIAKPLFELGVGPSAGLIFANKNEDNKPIFDYGLGASAVCHIKRFFIGFESRYVLTKQVSFTNLDNKLQSVVAGNLNNLRTFLKFGYKFYK